MRKALEFPRIDEGKLDAVEALIAAIADKEPGTAGAELEDLAALTGKVHTDVEFAEYWSWTDLDTLARLTPAGNGRCATTRRCCAAPSPCPMSWTLWPPVKM